MEAIRSYLSLAHSTTCAEFVAQTNPLYFLKRPVHRATATLGPPAISFETKLARLDIDPFAAEWRIVAVKKREGNPYPDRFSIGRAPNCDVVVRLPSVSKVHAHVLIVVAGD